MTDDTTARACSTNVYDRGCFGRSHQCERAASVERAGKFFCKQHDPVAIKAKSDARTAKWEAEFAASQTRRKLIDRAIRSFEPMRDALKAIDAHWTEDFPDGPEGDRKIKTGYAAILGGELAESTLAVWRQIRAALALAE